MEALRTHQGNEAIDLSNVLAGVKRHQTGVVPDFGKRTKFGVTIGALVTNVQYRESKGTKVCAYTVEVQDIGRIASDHPAIALMDDGEGFVFTKSDEIRKRSANDVEALYKTYAEVARTADPQADVEKALYTGGDKPVFQADVTLLPFRGNRRFEVRQGKVIYFDVFVGSQKDVIPDYSLVQVNSLALDAYAWKPTEPPQHEETAGYVTKDGTQFRFKLKAGSVTKINDERNDLPEKDRKALFKPAWSQEIYNPVEQIQPPNVTSNPILIVSPVEQPIPAEVGKRGRFLQVCANLYTRNGKSETAPDTFQQKMSESMRTVCPIVLKVTNAVIVPSDDSAKLDALRTYYPASHTDNGVTTLMRDYVIQSMIWPKDCRRSGIADLDSWIDVFTHRPMDATVEFSRGKDMTPGETLSLYVASVNWHHFEYLEQFGVPLTLDFAKELLGNKTVLENGDLGKEKVKDTANKKQEPSEVDVLNGVNSDSSQNVYLLNASEYNGKIVDHLNPAKGWQCRAIVVPRRENYGKYGVEKQKKIDDALLRLQGLKDAAEGDKVLREVHRLFTLDAIAGFGSRRSDVNELRCIVFFYKPLASRFSAEILAKRDPETIAKTFLNGKHPASAADTKDEEVVLKGNGKRLREEDDGVEEPEAKRARSAPVSAEDEDDMDEEEEDDPDFEA